MALSDANHDKKAPSVSELEAQIAELRREVSSLTKSLAAFGAAKVGDYKSSLEGMASDAISGSLKAMESAKAEAHSLEREFEAQVRSKPLQSIGIAVGVGFLAAILTRRT